MQTGKVVLITGISSGIGRETATLLANSGFRVFGTVRGETPPAGLGGVEVIRLDVTDEAAAKGAVATVLREAGRLDALVNNAGYNLVGGVEETSIAEAQALFDTNVFGALRLIKAALPAMRAQRSGRIVNISSVLGFLPAPFMGLYAASKHALEGLTESLDHEVRAFGIRAVLVEPSFTVTKFGASGKPAAGTIEAYAETRARVTAYVKSRLQTGADPAEVAKVVLAALTDASPRQRYTVGEGAKLSRLRRFVPPRLFDRSFRKQFRLDTGCEAGKAQEPDEPAQRAA